jgi:adenylosuccinate lyase
MYYRYERESMKTIWSEDNSFDLWLKVEIAASIAWADIGVVPHEDAEKIRNAKFDRALYDKWFEETRHDVVSFTRSVTPSLGPEGRWIHHGLTSNDVKDTALSLQMVQAVDEIDSGIDRCMAVLKTRA